MNKIGIALLIIVVLGLGYYFSIGRSINKNENLLNTTQDNIQNEDSKEIKENKLDSQKVEENKKINNNLENKKYMQATLHTNKGNIVIEFDSNTPNTVNNFIKLAKEGFYNGTKFHRVIKGFMNQGGDPLSKDDSKKQFWGTGGPGYKFDDEITSKNKNDKYTISMANAGPNTNGSQFFINVVDNNFLDTKHTVFGKVIEGMNVVDMINSVKTDSTDKPIDPVIITSITLK